MKNFNADEKQLLGSRKQHAEFHLLSRGGNLGNETVAYEYLLDYNEAL